MRATAKKPLLYRSVNTRTHGVRHGSCGAYRYERNTKTEKDTLATRGSMHNHQRHGFDYTPLFRFLLSKVGQPWDAVFSEANARLDRPNPVFWVVALHESEKQDYVRTDENSYYSGLYVDDAGLLQKVEPQLTPENMKPYCDCCTHTFNGVVVTQAVGYAHR
ncbi:hypothetical protein IFR35_25560 [Pseudomonas fluorescens]|uniref:hypothetical protein n=1 Tax=Pseudomonas TaxID=286 RepID=UPI000C1503B7|nr:MULTISPECIES: hypothetical protein [Pseudomonas]MBD8194830.1 hypothetical protein [Pseudomonas fluorescens]MBD8229756.1 hypothetical protein [Pseudomonas fluorescens]MBD8787574.1 hypothetical protein [Pseudomonas fluorescens]MBD8820096.1 hypothetical protein [Pseudomonas fluorescens]PIB52368.1 hypothetical protein AOA60_26870 [Pseudomonas sp. 2822-17]